MLLAGLRPSEKEGSVARTPRTPARDCVPCTPALGVDVSFETLDIEGTGPL